MPVVKVCATRWDYRRCAIVHGPYVPVNRREPGCWLRQFADGQSEAQTGFIHVLLRSKSGLPLSLGSAREHQGKMCPWARGPSQVSKWGPNTSSKGGAGAAWPRKAACRLKCMSGAGEGEGSRVRVQLFSSHWVIWDTCPSKPPYNILFNPLILLLGRYPKEIIFMCIKVER